MASKNGIRAHKESILKKWEALSREKFPAAHDKSKSGIRNHLPELLDALSEVLETHVLDKPKEISKTHSRQRFSFGDYTLSQVMGEYTLLKDVIFDQLEKDKAYTHSDYRLISRFFDSACTTAAAEFAELREEQITESTKNLHASNADLERFTAVAAHDLRSPACTIMGYAELILDENEEMNKEDITKSVQTIRNVTGRMIQLIDQLLEYTKIGKSKVIKESFSVSSAAENAKSNLTNQIEEARAQVLIDTGSKYTGDKVLFEQMLQNLIGNSLKFRSPDRKCEIQIKAFEDDDYFVINVKDNGMGFNSHMNQEIFEPFRRGQSVQGIKGSGLGLATVKRIIELHDGTITATGQSNQGADFKITLPKQHH